VVPLASELGEGKEASDESECTKGQVGKEELQGFLKERHRLCTATADSYHKTSLIWLKCHFIKHSCQLKSIGRRNLDFVPRCCLSASSLNVTGRD